MRRDVLGAWERLAATERQFRDSEFLVPVSRGQLVMVRIAGVVCSFEVLPRSFEGWGVFRCEGAKLARLVREATLAERSDYLQMFAPIRMLVVGRSGNRWYGRPAGDSPITVSGPARILLPLGMQPFDTVVCRCDGRNFWFELIDRARVRPATYLREALVAAVEPTELTLLGLTPREVELYRELLQLRQEEIREEQRDRVQERLANAASHAGGVLLGYRELPDAYVVEYTVDGERETSVLSKVDLTTEAAGICLAGEDRRFDFTSLVGVIREGRQRHRIHRVGIDRHTDMG